ncbi:MAG: aminotransferase class I/II-fold pyridoxal phosphate-dependent enzyme [Sandaracinaceae bacterium]|nr:aminotransferase class I/II-fold pyridoxal phosphate-dependent enzyme [Sandaracinaceae bacterium]
MSWLHERTTELLSRVAEVKAHDAFPFFRPMQNVGSRVAVNGASYVNFTSNDYLGLSTDPRLAKAAIAATITYGTGLGSARPQATSVRHDELERRLAGWLGYGGAAVFTTGYQALVGTLGAFLGDDTTVIVDRLAHASIMDGVLLARGQHPDLELRFFKHDSMRALERCLETAEHDKLLVVVEGLYSVDGDFGTLDETVALAKKYGAAVMVDDAHGLGTLGPTGRGVAERFGVLGEVDLLVGTFSKSFGGVGGFVVADAPLVDFLKLSARAFLFSASLPVAQVDAALAALDVIEREPARRARLADNARFFREGLLELGFDLGESETHITPIMIRDERRTLEMGATLFHGGGIMMMPFVAPGVPAGTERLRCNVTAAHTRAQMGYALEVLAEVGKRLDVLPMRARTSAPSWKKAWWMARHAIDGALNAGPGHLAKQAEVLALPPLRAAASDVRRAVRRRAIGDGWSDAPPAPPEPPRREARAPVG